MELMSDLVRGNAAYTRDAAEDLADDARALRAKGQVLRRHGRAVQAVSVALRDESERLLRQIACDREVAHFRR